MVLRLSDTQVIVSKDSNTCKVCVDTNDCTTITAIPLLESNSFLLSGSLHGRHNYTLKGCLTNSLFSQQPGPEDYIYIGISTPYQTAQTSRQSTTYITPLLTAG